MKKLFSGIVVLMIFSVQCMWVSAAPSFNQNYAKPLLKEEGGKQSSVFNLGIDPNKNIQDNIKDLFYPGMGGNKLWNLINTIAVAVIVVYIILIGLDFISGDEGKIQKAQKSFLYLGLGAFFVFGSNWFLSTVLNLGSVKTAEELTNVIQNSVFFQILAFMKSAAFFIAIVMMVVYGFRYMRALDDSGKAKEARTGIINVIVALVFIKVIDFIFFIAQQQTFKTKAIEFTLTASKFVGYLIGAIMLIMVFYAGFLLLFSQGKTEALERAKKILTTVFVFSLIIFLFLLITYQIISTFGG